MIKVIDILNTFIIFPNSKIKEQISSKKNRIFLKFLFNYIQGNHYRGPKDLEESILLQEKIFILLRQLIKRNVELKNYISKGLNFIKIIEIKSMDMASGMKQLEAAVKAAGKAPSHYKFKACFYEEDED